MGAECCFKPNAFGMVGASISGITFVSVPGMVMRTDMTYLQMCLGFIVGYFLVGFLLLPIYYRYNLKAKFIDLLLVLLGMLFLYFGTK